MRHWSSFGSAAVVRQISRGAWFELIIRWWWLYSGRDGKIGKNDQPDCKVRSVKSKDDSKKEERGRHQRVLS